MSANTPFTITYKKPGTSPPIFLAGSFSDPEWELQEMDYTTGPDGEHTFQSKLMVEAGKDYQFKLRIGHSEWWLLAENHPVATDESGNQNNLLNVPEPSREEQLAPAGINTPAINVKDETEPTQAVQAADDIKDETDDIKMPLFAHECLGAYEFGDDDSDHEDVPSASNSPELHAKTRSNKSDTTDVDVNDPTLEKFPSDRGSILDALRTIQTHLGEDHTHLDDIPTSPRVVSARRTSLDSADELSLSPAPLSPTTTRRRESRLSHSSFGRSRSAVSLGPIAEEPKSAAGKKPQSPHIVSLPNPNGEKVDAGVKSPPSEEDEAVVMRTSEVKPTEKTDNVPLAQVESNEAQRDQRATNSGPAPEREASPAAEGQETQSQADVAPSASESAEDQPSASAKSSSISRSQDDLDTSTSASNEAHKDAPPVGDSSRRGSRGNVLPMIVTTGALAVAIGIGWWQTTD
ncbi:hypothetical protein FZEAL_684 [Fusarium zealandicum]|uniref:AMP-activated protein kinase glycogen-binding domain-containing protein n=1 Tax=Fusarium zealandicum TaxID=1053134 RepID=A0A8H4XPH4_9HYPO|nr:hypothetical protein FZEAL_684 [Fusarium zealandicum]